MLCKSVSQVVDHIFFFGLSHSLLLVMEGKQIVCYLYFLLSIFYSNTLNDIYVDSAEVEMEHIDIGEPENTGMHHIV